MLKSGIDEALIFLISHSDSIVSGKLCRYVLQASLSISFAQTISNPACANAKSIPPIPANKLHTLGLATVIL